MDDLNQFLQAHGKQSLEPSPRHPIYLKKKINFGVAVSGGSDSIALIMLLKQFISKYSSWFQENLGYTPTLYALHIDHKIREESTKESKEIRQVLTKLSKLKTIKYKRYIKLIILGIQYKYQKFDWNVEDKSKMTNQEYLREKVFLDIF